jgi:gamma-glutamylcyclotransferase
MATILYFAYGSNMLTERLQARCPSALPVHVAKADNWKMTFSKPSLDDSGKGTLTPAFGSCAFGIVFELVATELATLDKFEGAGKGYSRNDEFEVRTTDTEDVIRVVTYIADVGSVDNTLKPYDWYLRLVVAGAQQHRLPPDYVADLAATPSVNDLIQDRPTRLAALKLLEKLCR